MNVQVAYNYKYFIVANYVQQAINEFIQTKNIQYAYVIGFSIKNMKTTTHTFGSRLVNQINEHVAVQINHFFKDYQDKLLFMSENDLFFVLLKANVQITKNLKTMSDDNYLKKRKSHDLLAQFESFRITPFEFQNVKISFQNNLFVSLYGVHDNNIFNLIHNLENMIQSFEPKCEYNLVQLLNPQIEFTSRYDMQQFQRLKQLVDINQIQLKAHVINYRDQKIVFPIFSLLKLTAFNTETIIRITPQHLRPIMIKHLAAKALQHFSTSENKHTLLMTHYPIESLLDPNFSTQIFYSKISHFDLSARQIILLLNLNFLNPKLDLHNIVTNVNNLKKIGIRFVCSNVNVHNIDFVIQINPYFVFYQDFKPTNAKELEYKKLMKKMLTQAKVNYYNI
jgi:hypothetical protein